jgi:tripartite ATP-independent transporter DctP family solute receptor
MYVLSSLMLVVLACGANAQEIKERKLRFGLSLAKDHPVAVGAQKFADLVAQKSGGKMTMSIYPSAVLGSDQQNMSAVQGGTLDFASMSPAILAGINKEMMLLEFPFLFNTSREAYAISDGPVGTHLMDSLAAHGIVGLGIWDLGFRNVTNSKRPITKVEDIQGLRLRVISSPIYLDLFNTLGANPVPMTFGEVYTALETKTIDGQENPVGVIESAKFAEVQKYMSLTRHVYTGMLLLMSKKTWDSMSATERGIIRSAANEAKDEQRKLSQAKEEQAIGDLRKTMQVNDLAPAEIARLRQKVQPVIDKFTREVGEPLVQQTNSELAKLRAAK